MSFDLGNFAQQLHCDICGIDLTTGFGASAPSFEVTAESPEAGFPEGFWDEPPGVENGFNFDLPDYYPSVSFPEDGFILELHGIF